MGRGSGRSLFGAALVLAGAGAGCTSDSEGTESVTTAYMERLGSDTLAIEIVRRSPGHIEGEVLARAPVTRYMTYSLDLDETGAIRRFETEHVTPAANPAGPGRWHAVITMNGNLASVIREAESAGPDTLTFTVDPMTVPTIGRIPMPTGILETGIGATGLIGPGNAVFHSLTPWGASPGTTPAAIVARGGSEFELDFFGSPMIVSMDGAGHVSGVSGAQTTMKIEVEPIEMPDIAVLAADWAARDLAGTGLGAPSPPATAEAVAGGATITVNYSQPSKRGRAIWGGLVPYDEIWRTGANAATHLTIDRDVTIGDLAVPAGTYTLWTTFTADEAFLIVNKQTQIWGTAYDAGQDLGRIGMTREVLNTPVERFTISLDMDGADGTLSFAWDDLRFDVPVRVR